MTHPDLAIGAAPAAAPPLISDLATITAREIAHSYRGDAGTGSPPETVGQDLRTALGLRSGQHVLDVAAGNGRVTLAARHWCAATPKTAGGPALTFEDADVEALPFADHSFDAVASTFGTTFATNQDQAAAELLRVCKRGGKIGLTSWTPDGFIGQLIKTIASARAAAGRRQIAVALGRAAAHRGDVRLPGVVDPLRGAHLQLPLSLAAALARRFPDALRPGRECLCSAARAAASRRSPPICWRWPTGSTARTRPWSRRPTTSNSS